ncbi:hypothetical protein DH2020_035114 [Rehmannia glutinosa]|uniref:Uncharacterized protein n=1 Tax=Rehmannia glutinosa TaxID=99300 RepID=A0ABR0V8C4_REHGL
MVHVAYEHVEDPNQFTKLLEDAEKPLYPGCTIFTKLSASMRRHLLGELEQAFPDEVEAYRSCFISLFFGFDD